MGFEIKRGDIFYADLRPTVGSEQGGIRPVLIIQNDIGNRYSPTVICAAITSQLNKAKLPTHVEIGAKRYGMIKDSVLLLEQVRTIDKRRLKEKVCHFRSDLMHKVDKALCVSFGLQPNVDRNFIDSIVMDIRTHQYDLAMMDVSDDNYNCISVYIRRKINVLKTYCETYNLDYINILAQSHEERIMQVKVG